MYPNSGPPLRLLAVAALAVALATLGSCTKRAPSAELGPGQPAVEMRRPAAPANPGGAGSEGLTPRGIADSSELTPPVSAPPVSAPPVSAPPVSAPPGPPPSDAAPQASPSLPPRPAGPSRNTSAALGSLRAFTLAAPPGPLLPSDYELGRLQDYRPASKEEAALVTPSRAFLEGLLAGTIAVKAIAPERLDLVTSLAEPLFAPPRPVAYRLGRFIRNGDAALAKLRLEAAEPEAIGGLKRRPRAQGELLLRRLGEDWFVEGLALEPGELGRPPAPRAERFEPELLEP